jgi:hypothetical protein
MLLWSNLRYYPGIYLEGLRKATDTSDETIHTYYVGQYRKHKTSDDRMTIKE